ncbi:CoA-binding protein [Cladochytrium replicatum]|nr:CoA-binding protein [Cladochytrium replicatum]
MDAVRTFFRESSRFAVVGASTDRAKFGNKVLVWYKNHQLPVTPINPKIDTIEEIATARTLADAVGSVDAAGAAEVGVSIITPPPVTVNVLKEAASLGIKNVWLQPGTDSPEAISVATENGMNIIHGGPCILVLGEEGLRQAKL